MRPSARPEEAGVFAREADRAAAVVVDAADDVLVDFADQHHLDDLDRFLVGHAHAADEVGFLAEALHQGADLGATAVDDHGVDADQAQEDHVQSERLLEVRPLHRGAAVLDDEGLAAELADVRQRLQQDLGAPGVCHRLASPSAAARPAIAGESITGCTATDPGRG